MPLLKKILTVFASTVLVAVNLAEDGRFRRNNGRVPVGALYDFVVEEITKGDFAGIEWLNGWVQLHRGVNLLGRLRLVCDFCSS